MIIIILIIIYIYQEKQLSEGESSAAHRGPATPALTKVWSRFLPLDIPWKPSVRERYCYWSVTMVLNEGQTALTKASRPIEHAKS